MAKPNSKEILRESANELIDKLMDIYKNAFIVNEALALSLANIEDDVVRYAYEISEREIKGQLG